MIRSSKGAPRRHPAIAVLLATILALVAAACGDSGGFGDSSTTTSSVVPSVPPTSSTTTTTAPPETTTTTMATTTTEGSGAVTGLDGVRSAVVQIVTTGTYQTPVGEAANAPGAGSGFIIDPSGLAITNNHVVTGAALLDVYLAGDDRPRNAIVLAVSECSDLAVIDIAGDGFPFLEWHRGNITTGLPIFAAGYPLGDPEYTLLEGIVSKDQVDGETTWSSVDSVIEHSADTLPGNSGGPIVTGDGAVVAVNYAGNPAGQSFAIARDEALPILQQLQQGTDVTSIGVNGEAFIDGLFPGIWVYSVESGSPADRAGIRAGDVITRMEGIDLSLEGTMEDYCDILRSHRASDVLAVEVYREATDEIFEGQINGSPLVATFSFSEDLDVDEDPNADVYDEYVEVTDDSGNILVRVPTEWDDVLGSAWVNDAGDPIGDAVTASPDRDGFLNTWETPGVFIGASSQLGATTEELLDGLDFAAGSCDFAGRFDYDDGLYVGLYDHWENCGGTDTTLLLVAAEPADGSFIVRVDIQIVDERDWDAADKIVASYEVLATP